MIAASNFLHTTFLLPTYYALLHTLFQLCRNKIIFEIPPQRSKRIWLQKFKLFFASVDLLITSSPIIIMILLSKCQIKFLTTSSMQVDDVIIAGFSKEYLNQNKKKGEENIQSHSIIIYRYSFFFRTYIWIQC